MDAERPALLANRRLGRMTQRGQLFVRESHPLHALELRRADARESFEPPFRIDQLPELIEEPGIDARRLRDLVDRHAGEQRALDLEDSLRRWRPQRHAEIVR